MRKPALLSSTTFRLVLCALSFAGFDPTGLLAESAPAPRSAGKKVIVYKIRAADRLGVRVFQEDDLTSTPRVDAKGTINLPLVRELRVDGLTINEAERLVENAYREGRFLRKPQVTITVEEYGPREVTIGGSVKSPARYPLPLETAMTLLDLVSRAGGFTDTARGTAVRVTRIQPDGSVTTLVFDVESILKGRRDARAEDSSLTLEPNDIVYVPERII
jgi:polysaccharide export outer membrane protein